MKKFILLLLFNFFLVNLFAQAPQIDSLQKLLATTKEDTVKVDVLRRLSFYDQSFQHGLDLANEGLALAKKISFEKGEALCLRQVGNQYWSVSNFPMALHYYLESLKIFERIHNTTGLATCYASIGFIYKEEGDYQTALDYYYKSEALAHADSDNYRHALNNQQIGEVYLTFNKLDSALKYYQRSYELFNTGNDKFQFDIVLTGLGDIQKEMGNSELAIAYYRQAIRNGIAYNDTLDLSQVYLDIANFYNGEGQKDSAIFYAQHSLQSAQSATVLKNVIESGKLLSALYQNKDDKKALQYLQIAQNANDSLFSSQKNIQLQNMFFNETQRENELAEKEKKDAEERKQNIQYALMAFGIITFILLFLLFSRSIVANQKLISFFGVLGLLVVFEFINLLIHPWLASFTHESPVLMLLVLVLIASLLIPLHHRLEKWIKEKMIEKNKAIKLAAAKKIIEKLKKK